VRRLKEIRESKQSLASIISNQFSKFVAFYVPYFLSENQKKEIARKFAKKHKKSEKEVPPIDKDNVPTLPASYYKFPTSYTAPDVLRRSTLVSSSTTLMETPTNVTGERVSRGLH
jgi:hypothetical protein